MFSVNGWPMDLAYWTWIALAGVVALHTWIKYGLPSGVLFGWTAFSALRIFAAPTSPYAGEEPIWNASFSLAAASSLAFIWIVLSVAEKIQLKLFKFVAIVNTLLLFMNEGLLANNSMSGCLSACLIPFSPIAGTVGALIARQSQPVALLFIVLGLRLIRRRRFFKLAVAIAASVVVGSLLSRHALFDPHGREQVWADAWSFFCAHDNPFLGAGLGAFYYIGPWLTVEKYHMGFVWLHSDWFQILFEEGIVGVIAAFIVFTQALYKSRRNEKLFAALFAYGAFGIANFPLHNPITALLGATLFVAALAKAPKEKRTLRQN